MNLKLWLKCISEKYVLCKLAVHCLQDEPDDKSTVSVLKASFMYFLNNFQNQCTLCLC